MIAIETQRPRRRGVTLIEMLVVLTVLSVLIGLCAVTIQMLMRVGADAQSRRSAAAAIGRLAEQFRADVHASREAEVRPPSGLRLKTGAGATIEYRFQGGRVSRVETTGGPEAVARHEAFDLGRDGTATFENRDEEGRRFLVLVVGRKSKAGRPDPPQPEEILALIGKDRPRGGEPR